MEDEQPLSGIMFMRAGEKYSACMYCEHWQDLMREFKGYCKVHCTETSFIATCCANSPSKKKIEYYNKFGRKC